MKKLIIAVSVAIILAIGLYLLLKDNTEYVIKVKKIDNNSPDVTLKVYENDKEVEIDKIYYLDDVLLCTSENLTVNKFDIKNGEELFVILKDNKKVRAKVVMEE